MAGDSWLQAVPVGLVMFVGTIGGFVLRAIRKRRARATFPELGQRLGLSHLGAQMPGAAGTLKGTFEGFAVRVEADSTARIVVQVPSAPTIDLRNYDRWTRLPPGLQPFALSDRAVNGWLKTRLTAPEVAERVAADGELLAVLRELRDVAALREFCVADGRIEMSFDFGVRGLFPASAAEQALELAVAVAERCVAIAPANGSGTAVADDEAVGAPLPADSAAGAPLPSEV
jgi:hypothetical protein